MSMVIAAVQERSVQKGTQNLLLIVRGTSNKQILGVAGNQIQGFQFASVGGATLKLAKEKGLGREFPTDWLLQDIRN